MSSVHEDLPLRKSMGIHGFSAAKVQSIPFSQTGVCRYGWVTLCTNTTLITNLIPKILKFEYSITEILKFKHFVLFEVINFFRKFAAAPASH